MAIPAVCWVVFAILWFKNVEARIFFVMCVVCAPVFLVDSLDAMKSVPSDLRQMVESFRPSAPQTFTKVIFPSIVPNILTSWKINLTLAIRIVTIAEVVGAVSGIGHGLVVAQEMFSVAVALYVRSHYDTMTLFFGDAPAPREIVIIFAAATRGRLHTRLGGLAARDVKGIDGIR